MSYSCSPHPHFQKYLFLKKQIRKKTPFISQKTKETNKQTKNCDTITFTIAITADRLYQNHVRSPK